jgi:hypothetical protein
VYSRRCRKGTVDAVINVDLESVAVKGKSLNLMNPCKRVCVCMQVHACVCTCTYVCVCVIVCGVNMYVHECVCMYVCELCAVLSA